VTNGSAVTSNRARSVHITITTDITSNVLTYTVSKK